jgi:hypothetical protein
MEPTSQLSQFFGTWNLIPDSCKYQRGVPPVSATHTLSVGESPDEMHIVVHSSEVDGRKPQFEYDLTIDGEPHQVHYNGFDMTATATLCGHKLRLTHKSDDCQVDMECNTQSNEMPLKIRNKINDKWFELNQTYRH